MIHHVLNKIKMLITRGQIGNNKQVDGKFGYANTFTQFDGEFISQIYYPYGYTAAPPAATLGIATNMMGSGDNQCFFPYHTPLTPFIKLEEGEVIIGNPLTKKYVKFKQDETIEIIGNTELTGNLKVTGNINIIGTVSITGNLSVSGTISDSQGSMAEMRTFYNEHVHHVPSTPGNSELPIPLMS